MSNNGLPLSAQPEFVALPSDPSVSFTPEQEAAFFAPNIDQVLRRMFREAARSYIAKAQAQPTPQPVLISEMHRT